MSYVPRKVHTALLLANPSLNMSLPKPSVIMPRSTMPLVSVDHICMLLFPGTGPSSIVSYRKSKQFSVNAELLLFISPASLLNINGRTDWALSIFGSVTSLNYRSVSWAHSLWLKESNAPKTLYCPKQRIVQRSHSGDPGWSWSWCEFSAALGTLCGTAAWPVSELHQIILHYSITRADMWPNIYPLRWDWASS